MEELELVGELDSHAVEALRLELRQLAKRRGLDLKQLAIQTLAEREPSG